MTSAQESLVFLVPSDVILIYSLSVAFLVMTEHLGGSREGICVGSHFQGVSVHHSTEDMVGGACGGQSTLGSKELRSQAEATITFQVLLVGTSFLQPASTNGSSQKLRLSIETQACVDNLYSGRKTLPVYPHPFQNIRLTPTLSLRLHTFRAFSGIWSCVPRTTASHA